MSDPTPDLPEADAGYQAAAAALKSATDRVAAAERDVTDLSAKIASADPDAPDFTEIATQRAVAQARVEALRARLPPLEGALQRANDAVRAAALKARQAEFIRLGDKAARLDDEITREITAALEKVQPMIVQLHAAMRAGASLTNALAAAAGETTSVISAFHDRVIWTSPGEPLSAIGRLVTAISNAERLKAKNAPSSAVNGE